MLKRLTKKQVGDILVIPICTIIVLFLVIDSTTTFPWEIPQHSFSWAVNEGDEFFFDTTVDGQYSYTSFIPEELLAAANISISVKIVSLPDCFIESEQDFISLINTVKVSCTYLNGTDLSYDAASSLNAFVSRFILPIGGWEYIDWLYPDNKDDDAARNGWIIDSYLSESQEDRFYFGYYYSYIDSGNSWGAYISTATGIPQHIHTGAFAASSPDPYSWTLMFSQA